MEQILVYKKKIFEQLNGFEGNNTIASGDDFFLMERFLNEDKKSVHYIKSKEVLVKTRAVDSISELINQRVRWAAKSSNFNLLDAKIIGLIVLLANLSLIALPFLSWQNLISWELSCLLFLGKCFIDLVLLSKTAKLMEQKTPALSMLVSCLLYPFFSSFIALRAIFGSYQWKDRVFKK
uniref:glycosyltransferase family 2 protein n=1 Tax=Polaribacter sp. TaxID=1920175 RepID=UPI004048639D